MILDALIRQDDHSSATVHSWLPKAPLRSLLKRLSEKPPELDKLIFPKDPNRGMRLDFEALLSELVEIWPSDNWKIDLDRARYFISHYLPIASEIGTLEKMDLVFERAISEMKTLRGS